MENLTKKCPACAEIIKLEAKKCHFCGKEMDLDDAIADALAKYKEGKKQCSTCKKWDIYKTMAENYGMSDYCPHCKKALLDIEMLFV